MGVLSYIRYVYVPPQRVWFLRRFGLKMGIDFEHFGLKFGMVIRGNVFESLETYFSFQQPGRVTGEKEREIDKKYIIPAKFYLIFFFL